MKDAKGIRFSPHEKMRIFLDDDLSDRVAPEGWLHLRTAREVEALLLTGNVIALSLDNDLNGDLEFGQGYEILDFLEEELFYSRDLIPEEGITVHSANPAARKRMRLVAAKLGLREELRAGKPCFIRP